MLRLDFRIGGDRPLAPIARPRVEAVRFEAVETHTREQAGAPEGRVGHLARCRRGGMRRDGELGQCWHRTSYPDCDDGNELSLFIAGARPDRNPGARPTSPLSSEAALSSTGS